MASAQFSQSQNIPSSLAAAPLSSIVPSDISTSHVSTSQSPPPPFDHAILSPSPTPPVLEYRLISSGFVANDTYNLPLSNPIVTIIDNVTATVSSSNTDWNAIGLRDPGIYVITCHPDVNKTVASGDTKHMVNVANWRVTLGNAVLPAAISGFSLGGLKYWAPPFSYNRHQYEQTIHRPSISDPVILVIEDGKVSLLQKGHLFWDEEMNSLDLCFGFKNMSFTITVSDDKELTKIYGWEV